MAISLTEAAAHRVQSFLFKDKSVAYRLFAYRIDSRHEPREVTRLVIEPRQLGQGRGARAVLFSGRGNARAAEQDDGRLDAVFGHQQLGLQKLQLQPDRAQLIPAQEVVIGKGKPVGRRARPRRLPDRP